MAGSGSDALYAMGARLYSPHLGGFTSLDTYAGRAQDPASLNRYLYAHANPATLIDPSGHFICEADCGSTPTTTELEATKKAASSGSSGSSNSSPTSTPTTSTGNTNAGGSVPPTVRDDFHTRADDAWVRQSLLLASQLRVDPCAQAVGRGLIYCRQRTGTGGAGTDGFGEALHAALDVAGIVPGFGVVPDLINAAYYAAEGDTAMALFSVGAAVPFIGDLAGAGKLAAKYGDDVVEAGLRLADDVPVDVAQRARGPIVYRGLADAENPLNGLVARNPRAMNDIPSHVAGKRDSQWISTSRSAAIAAGYGGRNGFVAIDLARVSSEVVDISNGIPGLGTSAMLSNWSRLSREVVVRGTIPAEAIIRTYWP